MSATTSSSHSMCGGTSTTTRPGAANTTFPSTNSFTCSRQVRGTVNRRTFRNSELRYSLKPTHKSRDSPLVLRQPGRVSNAYARIVLHGSSRNGRRVSHRVRERQWRLRGTDDATTSPTATATAAGGELLRACSANDDQPGAGSDV